MQSSLDSILSIQVYPVKPCMEIYQVLVSHYHLFHINDMDIIPLSSIIYNENILCRLLFLLSLRSVVLWIACGLTAFIFQHNVVCLDIPFHICPSVVGVCHRIGNRIDKLHLGIVRILVCGAGEIPKGQWRPAWKKADAGVLLCKGYRQNAWNQ